MPSALVFYLNRWPTPTPPMSRLTVPSSALQLGDVARKADDCTVGDGWFIK
jgi:hypothetical protein